MWAEGAAPTMTPKLKLSLWGSSLQVVLIGDLPVRLGGTQTRGLLAFIVQDVGSS